MEWLVVVLAVTSGLVLAKYISINIENKLKAFLAGFCFELLVIVGIIFMVFLIDPEFIGDDYLDRLTWQTPVGVLVGSIAVGLKSAFPHLK